MSDSKFDVEEGGEFYITIADSGATVYESRDDAVSEVADKLEESDDAFIAETSITGSGEDVSLNLEQVPWTHIIPEITDD
jgi:azurin